MPAYTMTPATALAGLQNAATAVGATLPPGLTDEADRLTAATARLREHRADRDALAAAVMAALEADRDPSEDEAVAREVTRQSLYTLNISTALEDHKAARVRAVLKESTPAILGAFAPVVEAAGKTLTRALHRLPGVALSDTHEALRLQPAELAVWGQAREAAEHVSRVVGAWSVLMESTGQARTGRALAVLAVAPLSAAQLSSIGADPKRAHEPGEPLSLADPTEYRARVERVERDRERMAAEAQAEAQYQLTGRRKQAADVVPFGG